MLHKKINSELTIWFVTHSGLQFDIWDTQSLINAVLIITKRMIYKLDRETTEFWKCAQTL